MLKMVDGTGIIGVDMICPLGVSTPQPPNYDRVEMEGTGMLVLPNSLDTPLERLELGGKTAGKKEVIQAGEFEQGTITAHAGTNYDSNYRVRTKNYINLTSGTYEVTCTGAKLGNAAFYSVENKFEKMLSETHIPLPIKFTLTENKLVRVVFSNSESIPIAPTDIKNAILEADVSPEHPQDIVNSGKWNEETRKYEVDVKVTGKNLLDKRLLEGGEVVEFNGVECYKYIDNFYNFKYKGKFENGQQYAFTLRILRSASKESNITDMVIVYTDGSMKQMRFSHGELKTFVSDNGKTIDYFSGAHKFSVDCYLDLSVTRLSVGGQDAGYDPYKEQTLTLTSDRPITKWDRLVEQGGEIGWLYESKKTVLNEKTSWNIFYIDPNEEDNFAFSTNLIDSSGGNQTSLCKTFKNVNYAYAKEHRGKYGLYSDHVEQRVLTRYFRQPNESVRTIEQWKEWLINNPIELWYESKTSEFIPLPQSEQNAIRALKTYYPTTVITVDGGELDPDIKVTYRKEI